MLGKAKGLIVMFAVLPCLGLGDKIATADEPAGVKLLRVPNRGIQPQAVSDTKGTVHMIYFKGRPEAGDIFYVRSDNGVNFSSPMRVNSEPASAIAIGNIRGAHLALGKSGRVHVAWNGSSKAVPLAPGNTAPMLYTRLNDQGDVFEPQRNLIQVAAGLDGGGSVAADSQGNVYVAWHAADPGSVGEENRRMWVVQSIDEGKTFAPEKSAIMEATGACGCCGMRAFADSKGNVYMLYRSAGQKIHRDMYLLVSSDKGLTFQGEKLHAWRVDSCPMSSAAFAESAGEVIAAWETAGQVYFAPVDPTSGKRSAPIAAPGSTGGRKHPVVARNARGQTLLAWTEGMGWQRGGSLAWQVFDMHGKPIGDTGRATGVPTWSLVTAFARVDDEFIVVY